MSPPSQTSDARKEISTADLIKRLTIEKRNGKFHPYIEFIQLSQYRAFEPNARLTFSFPVTVLVGQNGSGKTSLLHALYGAPVNHSTGAWWFGTHVDPIDSEKVVTKPSGRTQLEEQHKASFWYGYRNSGKDLEVLKLRIRKRNDPDYWEPSRPVVMHGMQKGQRSPAIKMDVLYLNFKTQLSAFDRCFYFPSEKLIREYAKTQAWQKLVSKGKSRSPRIQDYMRHRSRWLKRVLLDDRPVAPGGYLLHEPVITLLQSELDAVSKIIGRQYLTGRLVRHRFYETWGTSVLFRTSHRQYSEAFAGSGESAVFRLVHELSTTAPGKLILLDEPETSLHPGAQERLLNYILSQTLEKKLQVVISTHSPALVRPLPVEAIKLLTVSSAGTVSFSEVSNSDEAFLVLGHPVEGRNEAIIEDRLALTLLSAVLIAIGGVYPSKLTLRFGPGGASALVREGAVHMNRHHNVPFILFDGDQRPKGETLFDLTKVSVEDDHVELDELIKDRVGSGVSISQNSNMSAEDKTKLRLQFMRYANKHFKYLPFGIPEQAIWNDEVARKLLSAIFDAAGVNKCMTECDAIGDPKEKFAVFAKFLNNNPEAVSSQDIQSIHQIFVRSFCERKGELYSELVTILKELANHA